MNSSTLRRKIAILLLGVSLLASAATAADLQMAAHQGSFDILARLASFLDLFWTKNGASLDPDGRPKGGGSLDPWGQKNGASLDPWGGEGGASLDPDGRPTENGASLDPNGLCSQSDCDGTPPQ
jgi:hypothetical protein